MTDSRRDDNDGRHEDSSTSGPTPEQVSSHTGPEERISRVEHQGHKGDDPAEEVIKGTEALTVTQGQDLEMGLSRTTSGPAYTVFKQSMVWWIVAMHFFAGFMSPMTGNIYFTAIPILSRELGVSISQINLTVTTYTIFQGLAPMFFGNFGDNAGRRPAFILAFTIFLGANIGLALQRNYVALLVLRMLQSTGASGTLALVYAVVADVAPPVERGKYMGFVGAGITMGPSLGPVLGGILAQYLGWPSIFWFLAIFTLVWLIPYILSVPETGRKVVGNGSIPARGLNKTLLDHLRARHQHDPNAPKKEKQTIPWPNPLVTLKLLLRKEMGTLLLYNGLLFVGFQIVAGTLSSRLYETYNFSELQIGLCYLPLGTGCMLSTIANGYILDWNYRRTSQKLGIVINRKATVDDPKFPIERVRVEVCLPQIFIGVLVYIGFAWSFHFRIHIAVPLVLSFFIGTFITGSFHILNILLVDLAPETPASATAANNLVRCAFGAISIAVIEDVVRGIGVGWSYSIIAFLILGFSPVLWWVQHMGPGWREEKRQKIMEEEKAGEGENRENQEDMVGEGQIIEAGVDEAGAQASGKR